MAAVNRLVRNFVVLFGGNVLGQLLFFLGFAYLARVLGPSEFGVWNFAQVWMLYLLRVGEFGLEVVGIKEISRNPGSVGLWTATVVSTRFVLALLLFGFALLVAALGLFPAGTSTLVLISALAVFPMAVLLEWVFEAHQEVGPISLARILKGFLFLLGVFLVVSSSHDAETAAFLYVGSVTLPGLIIFWVVVRRFGFDWSSISLRKGVDALVKSAPIGVATFLSQYSLSLTTILIGYFLSREELGFFTAAHRVVLFMWAYIITSMHRILLPSLSRSYHESSDRLGQFVGKFFRLSALAAIPVGLLGTLCATPLMTVLYSARYEASGAIFGILLWGFVLATIRSILEIALIASDRQKRYMKGMVFLSMVYTVLTPILLLRFGITGAAVAVVGCESIYFTYLVLTCPCCEPMSLFRSFWKPLSAAAVAMVPPLLFGERHPLLGISFGIAAFGAVVIALKGVTSADVEVIKSALRKSSFEASA